ncbi:hypothetical protein HDU85_002134 [Gaertneriomyces sp. JEL0708]|nr:hypothetical protein HDU85_002134 [Gaertneriomyces sp. JEL0708]
MHISFATVGCVFLATAAVAAPVNPVLEKRFLSSPWTWFKADGLTKLIAFGDSLSDNGNTFKLLNNSYPYPSHYFQGRYSNGPVWAEHLASSLKLTHENRAHGGSTTDTNTIVGHAPAGFPRPSMPGLAQQIAQWKSTSPQFDPKKTLFSVWSGGNDYFYGDGANNTPAKIADRIVNGLQELANAGAKKVVVFNLPPGTSSVPFVEHNLQLGLRVLAFAAKNPGMKIIPIDMTIEFAYLVINRQSLGFDVPLADVTKQCLVQPSYPTNDLLAPTDWTTCSDPDKLIMYDLHPSSRTHKVIADQVVKALRLWNIID